MTAISIYKGGDAKKRTLRRFLTVERFNEIKEENT